jgi:hypothetical protein
MTPSSAPAYSAEIAATLRSFGCSAAEIEENERASHEGAESLAAEFPEWPDEARRRFWDKFTNAHFGPF